MHICGLFLAALDISLSPDNIQYEPSGLVRDVETTMTATLNISHLEGAKLNTVPDGMTNYGIDLYITDGGMAPFNQNFSTDFAVTEGNLNGVLASCCQMMPGAASFNKMIS